MTRKSYYLAVESLRRRRMNQSDCQIHLQTKEGFAILSGLPARKIAASPKGGLAGDESPTPGAAGHSLDLPHFFLTLDITKERLN